MSEQVLCILGKNQKILGYIDSRTNSYIQLKCKLRDSIDESTLKEFFNRLYSMKLDVGYSFSFAENHNTGDLIRCFTTILAGSDVISLKELSDLISPEKDKTTLPILNAINEFFKMFEITEQQDYSMEEYHSMLSQSTVNPLVYSASMLAQENDITLGKSLVSASDRTMIRRKALVKPQQKTAF